MKTRRARWLGLIIILLPLAARADDLGLKVAPGFRASVFADETLANDTYAMTLDAHGRVAVTSQGFVKILHDDDGDGRADRAVVFAETPTGGMGLCFDGNDLMFCGDGWLSRYRDRDGDGRADGPPERLVPMRFTEHGGHAMRLGPDGWWYVIGGNDSGFNRGHATLASSPVRDQPEAGALLRISADGTKREIVAHGFRNPYDFDFNASGDLFTYDSDVERDYDLPWYTPTRIYQIAQGGHHGWRLTGYMRSWCRRDYFLDTVDILAPIGRGSPTGVACYRHDRFPARYRDGVFALDWTFGKVWFLGLAPEGASYATRPEVFLEPEGSQGFDPTDAVVAPDGSLLISIGGRKTRGAVYRVEYVGGGARATEPADRSPLLTVLMAPQPLDAWSRARWVPQARALGPEPFAAAVGDASLEAPERVRAIEVLTELFGGLPRASADAGSHAAGAMVRARVAWSLGRIPKPESLAVVTRLADDGDPRVQLAALDALADRATPDDGERVLSSVRANLGHGDKRVRQAAARLAARLPEESWRRLLADPGGASPQARLTYALAAAWRSPAVAQHEAIVEAALAILDGGAGAELPIQAARLIVLALGDYNLEHPPVEIFTGYSLPRPVPAAVAARVLATVRRRFPSGDDRLDLELARILAMLEDDAPESLRHVLAMWTEASPPTRDVHYLVVCARLRAERDAGAARKTATTLLGLDRKLGGQERRIKQSWGDRLDELVRSLEQRDPRLADAILADAELIKPAHVAVALALEGADRARAAARLFKNAIQADADFEWSPGLVAVLARLPAQEIRPLLRAHWDNFGLRDAILLQLVSGPEAGDRDKFIAGLESAQPQVVAACLEALEHLPRDESPEPMVPLLRLLRRLQLEPREGALRKRLVALLARQTGRAFPTEGAADDPKALTAAYQPIFAWFHEHHPAQAAALDRENTDDASTWDELKASIDWSAGRADRGEAVFRARACQTCHAGSGRLGPDLAGVAGRLSRDDLWAAIVAPNRDVAPPYRVTMVETRAGAIVSGIVAFESADGLILQTGASETRRIATPDIASRQPSLQSLMPTGLLKDLSKQEIADLFRYIEGLEAPKRP